MEKQYTTKFYLRTKIIFISNKNPMWKEWLQIQAQMKKCDFLVEDIDKKKIWKAPKIQTP